ncbi:MAG TPA: cation:proton antiporter [Trichormus sp.]
MNGLNEHQLLMGLLAISCILFVGRGTAEVSRRFGQPEVLGELFGGLILGPSLFGALAPKFYHELFTEPGVVLPLSMISWTGAILLLMLAGAEVDLLVLKNHVKAGVACAVCTIVPSILVGSAFGIYCMHLSCPSAIFLGAVVSVTAVSVVAKIFMESQVFRRDYAQVILAAGIASEIIVWPVISVLAAMQTGGSQAAGVKTCCYAVLFCLLMLTIGQRFADWSMRKIADVTQITYGQVSLVVILGTMFASVTQILGLHALLGPFIFGIVLGRAPRTTPRLKESLHSMTMSIFAPVFFVTAGMRIDVHNMLNLNSALIVIGLFVVSFLTKLIFGFIGGQLGGLRRWESVLVGLATNMRGGSDVVVAILGGALTLLPEHAYATYAIVAIITVMILPRLIAWVAAKVPPTEQEQQRLTKEEASKRAYLSTVEKILLPSDPIFHPTEAVPALKSIAATKESQNEILDIIELCANNGDSSEHLSNNLSEAAESSKISHSKSVSKDDPVESLIEASAQCDLLMLGAPRPGKQTLLTFGALEDKVIDRAQSDVFVLIGDTRLYRRLHRILVPLNGMEHALAAADIAAYIARANDAEIVFFTVLETDMPRDKRYLGYHRIRRAGMKILKEAEFRTRRLDVAYRDKIVVSQNPRQAIVNEINSGNYDLVVLGAVDRSGDSGIMLGRSVPQILTETTIPAGVLVLHQGTASAAA